MVVIKDSVVPDREYDRSDPLVCNTIRNPLVHPQHATFTPIALDVPMTEICRVDILS